MKKKILIVLGGFVLLIVIAFVALTNGLSDVQNAVLSGIDLTNVSDGEYTGTYEKGRWTNILAVRVKNNAIVGIDIAKDFFTFGNYDCSEEVFRRVIEKQDTHIDAVSGATATTKAYLKAIEDALK